MDENPPTPDPLDGLDQDEARAFAALVDSDTADVTVDSRDVLPLTHALEELALRRRTGMSYHLGAILRVAAQGRAVDKAAAIAAVDAAQADAEPLTDAERAEALGSELDVAIAEGADPADLRDLAAAYTTLADRVPVVIGPAGPDPRDERISELEPIKTAALDVCLTVRETLPDPDYLTGRYADLGADLNRLAELLIAEGSLSAKASGR